MTHGEGLAGQHAAGDNTAEQLMLLHGRKQEANSILLLGQFCNFVITVDIVDFSFGVGRQVLVEEGLQAAQKAAQTSRRGKQAICIYANASYVGEDKKKKRATATFKPFYTEEN